MVRLHSFGFHGLVFFLFVNVLEPYVVILLLYHIFSSEVKTCIIDHEAKHVCLLNIFVTLDTLLSLLLITLNSSLEKSFKIVVFS